MEGKLTHEGQDDKEGAQVHRVGVGQILELDPCLVEEAERLLLSIHPNAKATRWEPFRVRRESFCWNQTSVCSSGSDKWAELMPLLTQ